VEPGQRIQVSFYVVRSLLIVTCSAWSLNSEGRFSDSYVDFFPNPA
jgi:hypothetical protein